MTNSLGLAGFVSGYMTPIPQEWQSQFGGPYLTGQCCLAIISRTSFGPSATVFDPTTLGPSGAPGTTVLGYPASHPTLGNWINSGPANPLFDQATTVGGIVFAPETGAVLFFGRTGTGPQCYGEGTADPTLAGTLASDGEVLCLDPTSASKGTHAYPYVNYVWAYRASDLVSVKQGAMHPWDVQPYATWKFDVPFETAQCAVNGAAYDPATQRIFLSIGFEDGSQPLIQVFSLQAGASVPYTPPAGPVRRPSARPPRRPRRPRQPTRARKPRRRYRPRRRRPRPLPQQRRRPRHRRRRSG